MVTTMNWIDKYTNDLAILFSNEQEFVDATFILIVMVNFGVWLTPDELWDAEEVTASG